MAVILVLALAGLFGPREETVESAEAGYRLTMEYGSVVRPGLPVPMSLTITHQGGFDGPVTVSFAQDVFDRFDFQNWYPNPDSETGQGEAVVYEFAPPAGDTLAISLDARVAPLQGMGRYTYWVAMQVDGELANRVEYDVWVMP